MALSNLNGTWTLSHSEYQSLLERDRWLSALEDAGVDNWRGISYAYETLKEWEAELDERT